MAGDYTGSQRRQLGILLLADLLAEAASGREWTAAARERKVGRRSRDAPEMDLVCPRVGIAVHQCLGVGMMSALLQRFGRLVLHKLAAIHDDDAVRSFEDSAEVVADQ